MLCHNQFKVEKWKVKKRKVIKNKLESRINVDFLKQRQNLNRALDVYIRL